MIDITFLINASSRETSHFRYNRKKNLCLLESPVTIHLPTQNNLAIADDFLNAMIPFHLRHSPLTQSLIHIHEQECERASLPGLYRASCSPYHNDYENQQTHHYQYRRQHDPYPADVIAQLIPSAIILDFGFSFAHGTDNIRHAGRQRLNPRIKISRCIPNTHSVLTRKLLLHLFQPNGTIEQGFKVLNQGHACADIDAKIARWGGIHLRRQIKERDISNRIIFINVSGVRIDLRERSRHGLRLVRAGLTSIKALNTHPESTLGRYDRFILPMCKAGRVGGSADSLPIRQVQRVTVIRWVMETLTLKDLETNPPVLRVEIRDVCGISRWHPISVHGIGRVVECLKLRVNAAAANGERRCDRPGAITCGAVGSKR